MSGHWPCAVLAAWGFLHSALPPKADVRHPCHLTKLGASSPNLPIRHGTYRSAPRFKHTGNFGCQRQQELQLWFGSLH
jgi:hypothetical protein